MDYEVSYLSLDNNKLKISLLNKNSAEKLKLREKLLKGLHHLYTYELDFIHHFDHGDGIEIYLANTVVLALAERILARSNIYEQLINYETYEKIGHFYLTILTIKNTELIDHPVFPIMYLIHENDDEKTHFEFWKNFVIKKLDFEQPISVSKEKSILSAVVKCLAASKSKLFFCSNKIVNDVNAFCSSHSNANDGIKFTENNDYKAGNFQTGIENLVSCNFYAEYEELYNEFKTFWSDEYLNFFTKKISPLIVSNLNRKKASNLRVNCSNEVSCSVEPFINNKEFSLTDLIMRLYKSSCQFVIKTNQAHSSGQVKAKFKAYSKSMIIRSPYVDYMEESRFKDKSSCLQFFNSPSVFTLFHFQIADVVLNNDLIILDQTRNVFIVKSPFNETINTVYDNQGKTECTCPLTNLCFHKIAAKHMHLCNTLWNQKNSKSSTITQIVLLILTTKKGVKSQKPFIHYLNKFCLFFLRSFLILNWLTKTMEGTYRKVNRTI